MAVSAPRSSASTRSSAPSRKEAPAKRFDDALRRAEGAVGREPSAHSPPSVHRQLAPTTRRLDERRPDVASGGLAAEVRFAASPPPGIPELQAAVRAAPPAIAAAMASGGPAQLALTFGSALSVDLQTGPQGLTLSLRPSPSLDRAARAELPRLLEALRARGLRVARAEVRGTMGVGAAQAPSRAR